MSSDSALFTGSHTTLFQITTQFLDHRYEGGWSRSERLCSSINRRTLGTLSQARKWVQVFNVPLPESRDALTPNDRKDVQVAVRAMMGLDFKCRPMIDRDNATVLRIEVRLHRQVTQSQVKLDAFFERAKAQAMQAKALAKAPAWNAFAGPVIAEHNEETDE
jgi:hypothetical protein